MSKVKIGDIEINVITSEQVKHSAQTTDHSVEKGEDISDHTKTNNPTIDITGAVMGKDASNKLQKLKKYQKDGELIKFVSRNIYGDMFILDIATDHNVKIRNGFEFDIVLKRVNVVTAQEFQMNAVNPTTKKSDAKVKAKVKPQSNHGRQQLGGGNNAIY